MWPWTRFLSSHKNLWKVQNDLMLQIKSNKLQKIENIKEMTEREEPHLAYLDGPLCSRLAGPAHHRAEPSSSSCQ